MKLADPKLDAIVKRPVKHLAHWSREYPLLWREHDQRTADMKKVSPWPRWCYAPHYVTAGCDSLRTIMKDLTDGYDDDIASSLSTMAAWRLTKGIYLYDPTIFEELWRTPLDGDLPTELLLRLPEWCVYIPLQEPFTMGGPSAAISDVVKICHGFFAHLEYKVGGQIWLILTMDMDSSDVEKMHRKLRAAGKTGLFDKNGPMSLAPIVLRLGGDLEKCLEMERGRVERELEKNFVNDPELARHKSDLLDWTMGQQNNLVRPAISLLLYLCSTEPDVKPLDPLRGLRNERVKTKKGMRNFGPAEPLVWEVAYRIGTSLRQAREAAESGERGEGTHASPRPHIRCAHWHHFWTGPRASITEEQPTQRKLILKWVPPTAVALGKGEAVIPTVHPVRAGRASPDN